MKTTIAFLVLSLTVWFAPGTRADTTDTPPRDSRVFNVYCRSGSTSNNFAQRGKSITILVTNLNNWLNCSAVSNDLPKGIAAKRENLVPYIKGIPMVGSKYLLSMTSSNSVEKLVFKLDRDADDATSKESWKQLFSSVGLFGKPVVVSVGFAGSWVMETDVHPGKDGKRFSFVTVPVNAFTIIVFVFIVIVLLVFFKSAAGTWIIRDPYAPLRPDGDAAFSLARTQMAFWFFLVLASYVLLWAMTGDKDTIPDSLLVLMGISAGTALGSAFVDTGKSSEEGRGQYFRKPKPEQSNAQLVAELVATKQDLEQKLMDTLKALENLPGTALVDIENKKKEQQKIEQNIRRTDVQLAFYKRNPLQRFTTDILGDDGEMSFHRYQMAVWTLVLGIVFVKEVVTEIAMPEFSATLLALMGISGGTYIGFKIPTAKS